MYVWQSTMETYSSWQNFCKHAIAEVKKTADVHLNQNDAPGQAWSHAFLHAVYCLNQTAVKFLGYRTPHEYLFGKTPDLSALQFSFWEWVIYAFPEACTPEVKEAIGHFLGIAEYVEDAFTFWLLADNGQIIACSCVWQFDEGPLNKHLDLEI